MGAGARRLGLVLLGLCVAVPVHAERIRSFEADLLLHEDASFDVTERIVYDFGPLERHGIFRDIPLDRGRRGEPAMRLTVVEVTDAADAARPYRVSRGRDQVRIRIGDPDRTSSGVQDYVIRYRVERAILHQPEHDELYWNATGTQWPVPIEQARARVLLPPGHEDAPLRTACFTGGRGSSAAQCRAERLPHSVAFVAERAFAAGEGLTLVVGLPKGILREPSASERFGDRLRDLGGAWWLLPLGALVGLLRLWRRHGRDPAGPEAIPVRYEPPEGLTPAEMGVVLDERADIRDVTATILDLAVRGHLEIEEVEGRRFLFLSDRDYRLRRHRVEDSVLKAHERLMLSGLFQDGDEVLVSKLRNEFYDRLPAIRKALYKALSGARGHFPVSPDRVRRIYKGVGIAILVVAGIALAMQLLFPPAALAVAASGALVLGFARVMPRRTRKGRRAHLEILGFREFVRRVDADRLERLGGRSAERFERVLPYAIVLDVADEWAEAFASIYTEPPRWYHSSHVDGGFRPRRFMGDLGRSLDTLESSLTSRPGGSGVGFSGFSGGSSGGGFGGGGGGSW